MGKGLKKNRSVNEMTGPQNPWDVFNLSFSKVYPPDSWNPIKKKFNGQSLLSDSNAKTNESLREIKNFCKNKIIRLTSFLGFPNYSPSPVIPTLIHMLGWQDDKSISKNIVCLIIALIRIALIPFTLLRNLTKLVTEFLPCLSADMLGYLSVNIHHKLRFTRIGDMGKISKQMIGYALGYGAVVILRGLCEGIHFIGKALTSPLKGMEAAWHFAMTFQKSEEQQESEIMHGFRITCGTILLLLSFSITTVAFTCLLPLLITGASSLVNIDIGLKIGNTLSSIPVISQIGHYVIIPCCIKLFAATLTSAMAGLAAIGSLAGAGLIILGTPVSKFLDYLHTREHKTLREVVNIDRMPRTPRQLDYVINSLEEPSLVRQKSLPNVKDSMRLFSKRPSKRNIELEIEVENDDREIKLSPRRGLSSS
jgi:hypothetical protein